MSKIFEHGQDEKQKSLAFSEKERDFELWELINGLHSGTKIHEKSEGDRYTLETHWNAEKKAVVVVRCWWVDAGDGDVMPEFEPVTSFYNLNEFIKYANHN
jgi:hypothetical protein